MIAAIYDREGKLFADYKHKDFLDTPLPPGPRSDGYSFSRHHLSIFHQIELSGEQIGTIYMQSSLEPLYSRVTRYAGIMTLIILGVSLVTLVLANKLQVLISKPILHLAKVAQKVTPEKEYSLRAVKFADDEVGTLTESFNKMLAEIQTNSQALNDANERLEKRVEQRTEELSEQVNVRILAEEALRQSEEQLRQSQKMEAIGRLAGGVAHDFNNILTAINGYSDLMLRRMDLEDPLRGNAEEIKRAGLRATDLTRQLLAFSRKQMLAPRILDLNAVIENMHKMLTRLIGEHIELIIRLVPDVGSIKADPGQIEQAILNLAINARDAMSRGGSLTIETSNVELDESYLENHSQVKKGNYVMLAISDTGCGMDEETRNRIFEPFFTTKEVGKGTGLGLSTTYGIVKQSEGHVWVYSEPSKGTIFKIYLPRINEKPELETADHEIRELIGGSETILLVEDEEQVRGLARRILESSGYTVLTASHGLEALRIIREYEEPIDLMLTDVVMPHMNGKDLYDRLVDILPNIKVIFMSGYTDTGIVHQGSLDPGMVFIQKPFTPDSLTKTMRNVLDGRRAA